jgi:hypothetical protein
MKTIVSASGQAAAAAISNPYRIVAFPSEFKKSVWQTLDRRYTAIFLATLLLAYGFLLHQALQERRSAPEFDMSQFVRKYPRVLGLSAYDLNVMDPAPEPVPIDARTDVKTNGRTDRTGNIKVQRDAFQSMIKQKMMQKMQQLSQLGGTLKKVESGVTDRFGGLNSGSSLPGFENLMLATAVDDGRPGTYVVFSQLVGSQETVTGNQVTLNANEIGSSLRVDRPVGQLVTFEKARIDAPASSGVSAAEIASTIQQYEAAIQATYQRFLKDDAGLKGKISVRIRVDHTGRVVSVTVMENTTRSDAFASAVAGKIKAWRFPRMKKNNSVTVSQSFVFSR